MPTVFPGPGYTTLPIEGERMLVQSTARMEAVSYWIRIGGLYSKNPWATRYYIFEQGLKGRALDGILVRVSQLVADPAQVSEQVYSRQERFVTDLVGALPPAARRLLLAGPGA